MLKRDALKREARQAAEARGHELTRNWSNYSGTVAANYCRWCKGWVQVNSRPMPNEIEISGHAVAVNCR